MDAATMCPSEHELTLFVGQRLADGESDRIRDHLDVCDPCRLGIVVGLSARHTEPATVLDTDAALGLHLGHFELVRRIGSGGMGVVYEAIDHRLGRAVALKLVRGDHDVPLLEEARAMARIRHPAVLTVYEAGVLDGSVYLATELIRGSTLREHCVGLRPSEIIAQYVRAAEGLAEAHAHGLVHRDFKPENVLVETGRPVCTHRRSRSSGRTAETRVLVADFGLATRIARDPELAVGSSTAGTPVYMSPEQIDGRPVDERVDIFAFCVSLWEALAGTRPFAGTTLDELRDAIEHDTPRLPRHVPAIVLRGLAVDPVQRPTLAALIVALRPRRRIVPIAAALAVIAVLAVILAVAKARGEPDLAARCATTPTPAQVTAGWRRPVIPAWVQTRVANVLEARDREVVSLQRDVCATHDDDARRAWISCRHDHAIEEAELVRALAMQWPSYDQLDDALELPWPATCASRAARVDAVLPAADSAKVTLARARFAANAGQHWRVDPTLSLDAERLLDQAAYSRELGSQERLAILDHAVERAEREGHITTAARAWLALAISRGDANADATSIDLAFAQASWAIERAGDPPMLRARWHEASAARAWQRSDLATADRHAQQAASLAGDDPHRGAIALHALAAAAAAHADFAIERTFLESLLASLAHAPQAEVARLHMAYAECLYHLDDLVAAHHEAELALALVRETAGDRDPLTAQALLVLGFVELDEGKPDACLTTTEHALTILSATVGPDHPTVGAALNLRSAARAAVHDWKGALVDSEAAAALFEARFGPRAEQVIFARMQGGEQAQMLGEHDKARTLLGRALDDARVTYGLEDPRTADAERSLASLDIDDHRDAEARALLAHAITAHERAHTAAPYLAKSQATLAKLDHDRALARSALTAWRGDPAWQDEYADLDGWLHRLEGHELRKKP
ncbi:MAG: serine/threonine-protein kinase [Deltaproteobacteria bacterium]